MMDVPQLEFKRVVLNRVITAKTDDNNTTSYWAQYFLDNGTLMFQKELSLEDAMKLVAKEDLTNKLSNL